MQAVKNGEVDFAIISTPAEVEQGLKMVELRPFYEVLVGGKTFTALASQRLTLKELSCYPLISLSAETKTFEFYSDFFAAHGLQYSPDIEASTADQVLPMVEAGLGIGFLPPEFIRAAEDVAVIDLEEQVPARTIRVVRRKDQPLSVAARELCRLIGV